MVLPVGPLVVTDELSMGELLVSSLVVPPVSGGVGLDSAAAQHNDTRHNQLRGSSPHRSLCTPARFSKEGLTGPRL